MNGDSGMSSVVPGDPPLAHGYMNNLETKLARFRQFLLMRFSDPDEERSFQEERRTQSVASARYVAYLGIFFIEAFIWQDSIISTENGYIAVYIRLYGALLVSVLAIAATYAEMGKEAY